MKKIMENDFGNKKIIKEGYSWTTYFFSFWPSLIRGDFKSALKLFLLGIVTLGIYPTYKSFNINRDYENYLIGKEYKEIGREDTGFKSHPILEKVMTWLQIVGQAIRAIVVIGIIIFSSIFAASNSINIVPQSTPQVQQNTAQSKTESVEKKEDNVPKKESLNTQSNNNGVTQSQTTENQNSRNQTTSNSQDSAGGLYKNGVTNTQLTQLQNKYDGKLEYIAQNYGSAYAQTGTPILGDDEQQNIQIAKTFFNQMDGVLNEEWGDIYNVLTLAQYKKVQEQQIQWVKDRDINAERYAQSANSGYQEAAFYIQRGVETRERIQALSQMYF